MIVVLSVNDVRGAPLVVPEGSDDFYVWSARLHENLYPVQSVCVAQLPVMDMDSYNLFLWWFLGGNCC